MSWSSSSRRRRRLGDRSPVHLRVLPPSPRGIEGHGQGELSLRDVRVRALIGLSRSRRATSASSTRTTLRATRFRSSSSALSFLTRCQRRVALTAPSAARSATRSRGQLARSRLCRSPTVRPAPSRHLHASTNAFARADADIVAGKARSFVDTDDASTQRLAQEAKKRDSRYIQDMLDRSTFGQSMWFM